MRRAAVRAEQQVEIRSRAHPCVEENSPVIADGRRVDKPARGDAGDRVGDG